MRTLYLDCFSGASGDMLLGALLDLGIESDRFIRELSKINLFGFDVEIERVNKYAITGTDVNVIVHGHEHHEDHNHDHEHPHPHQHDHNASHSHNDGHSDRSLKDILFLIDASDLDFEVKERSKRIFMEIAVAEGKVHGVPAEDVHFHEIGAVDSIVDIIGICICLKLLDIGDIYSSELHEGKGFVDTRHGRLPVPVPAVVAILSGSDIPVVAEDIEMELLTPTGAGVIKTLAKSFGSMPKMRIEHVGYGFGKRDTGRLNALRAIIGELVEDARSPGDTIAHAGMANAHAGGANAHASGASPFLDGLAGADHVIALDANIDDMTAEAMGYAMECLLAAGALDVFFTPVYMKKNRPATMLTVLARPKDTIILTDLIFKETTTLGVRETHMARTLMSRRTEIVELGPYGAIRCKIAERKGVKRFAPEYEDCKAYAARTGLSLAQVYELARAEFSKASNDKQ
ncbi:MAG: nickel pincer cofactor biosynthesis protein LarC [Oscillospiraceae bacterium]|nr:nickel pincer cofactor biosynthesis protein LarC [Oscillospiraceae bacterium]